MFIIFSNILSLLPFLYGGCAKFPGEFPFAPRHIMESAAHRAERIVRASQDEVDGEVVRRAAHVLLAGGVVVVPTDSVYGLCCTATPDNPAHRRIFEIKRRDLAQTLPWFVADPSGLDRYGRDVPEWAHRLAKKYWPGALTLVVRASDEVPAEYAQADTGTVALRVPDSDLVRAIVRETGTPLAQTSANTHGQAAATTGADIEDRLLDMEEYRVLIGREKNGYQQARMHFERSSK